MPHTSIPEIWSAWEYWMEERVSGGLFLTWKVIRRWLNTNMGPECLFQNEDKTPSSRSLGGWLFMFHEYQGSVWATEQPLAQQPQPSAATVSWDFWNLLGHSLAQQLDVSASLNSVLGIETSVELCLMCWSLRARLSQFLVVSHTSSSEMTLDSN